MSEGTKTFDTTKEILFLKQYVNNLQDQIDRLQDQLNELKWSVINVIK